MSNKIQPQHLSRGAYIYVRQSTGHQVRNHHQGRERQYELAERAKQLEFSRVIVIDDDQGKTGSGLVERPGFASLLTAVCGGDVGAVFALEASRLARNNRDWHHLIDLCALTETLIIDADGIYDPRQLNDRLLLGLKGTMSEFELNLFRQRAREAFELKVARGYAMWETPVGLVRDENDRVEKTPDRQVQSAIDGVFRKFRELGSARQVALWYRDEQIPLPEVIAGTRGKEINWRLPRESRIRQILKNPYYAGALAYGRTEAKITVDQGRARKSASRTRKPREKWKVLIQDNHVGYITWQEFLENQTMLESNASQRDATSSGAAKKGLALLSGLLRCGHCGRKLFVAYGGKGGRTPRYACHGGRENRGSASCQSLGGSGVDTAVSRAVLEALEPAGIEASIMAIHQLNGQHDERRKLLELSVEKARYEVDLARRKYDAVDPANRLVALELESRWNTALESAATLEQQLNQLKCNRVQLSDEQKVRLLELGRDLSQLWELASASVELKKRIFRTVLEEVVIRDDNERKNHLLVLHWKGGVHTELQVVRAATGKKPNDTSQTALKLIEELSKVCSDQTIAATLNRLGYKTGAGKTWRVHSVYNARYIHGLTNHRPNSQWVTIQQASIELRVSQTVITRLISKKILPAIQIVPTTPWIIDRASLTLEAVQQQVEAVKSGRQLKFKNSKQREFPFN